MYITLLIMMFFGPMHRQYCIAPPEPPPEMIMAPALDTGQEIAVTPAAIGLLPRVIRIARTSNQEQVRILISSEGVPQRVKVTMQGHIY